MPRRARPAPRARRPSAARSRRVRHAPPRTRGRSREEAPTPSHGRRAASRSVHPSVAGARTPSLPPSRRRAIGRRRSRSAPGRGSRPRAGPSAPPRTQLGGPGEARRARRGGERPRGHRAVEPEALRRGRECPRRDQPAPRTPAWPPTRPVGSTTRASHADRGSHAAIPERRLPQPGPPSSTRAAGPSTRPSRNASIRESSSTLPTTWFRLMGASGVIAIRPMLPLTGHAGQTPPIRGLSRVLQPCSCRPILG